MKYLFPLVCLMLISFKGFGQDNDKPRTLDDFYIDFATPDISAFQLLGKTPNDISRPGNIKELAASTFAFNNKGFINPGLGIDWSPGYTLGSNSSVRDYRKYYLLNALQITAGTLNDSLGSNLAFGLKWTPINKMDLLLSKSYGETMINQLDDLAGSIGDAKNEFKTNLGKYITETFGFSTTVEPLKFILYSNFIDSDFEPNLTADIDSIGDEARKKFKNKINELQEDEIEKKFKKSEKKFNTLIKLYVKYMAKRQSVLIKSGKEILAIKKNFLVRNWNAQMLQFSGGFTLLSTTGRWENLSYQKFVGIVTFANPLTKYGQLLLQVKYNHTLEGNSPFKSEFKASTRVLIGNQENRFSLEGSYGNNKAQMEGIKDDNRLRTTLGFEFKINDGLWFEIAAGLEQSLDNNSNATPIGLGNFKYALQKNRRFKLGD